MKNRCLTLKWILSLLLWFTAPSWAKVHLSQLQLVSQPATTTLSLSCSATPHYHYFRLKQPERLVIDFSNAQLTSPLAPLAPNALIKTIRQGYPKPHCLRLVLDLKKSPQQILVQVLTTPEKQKKLRIKLQHPSEKPSTHLISRKLTFPHTSTDVFTRSQQPSSQTPSSTLTQSLPNKLARLPPATPRLLASVTQSQASPSHRLITIVIDPGHGGHDPGATNRNGMQEKTINLAIAKKIQAQLSKYPKFKVLLTRKEDQLVHLRERLNFARRYRADLFLSIHADAFIHPYAKGASVFALSLRGASSEAARWLAARANNPELGGARLPTQDSLLRSIVINLSQTTMISESLRIGQYIIDSLGQIGPLHQTKIERAPFAVLKAPDVPSLLIETGFLSNPAEARRLHHPHHQQQIAIAIANGVKSYFKNK